MNPKDLVGAKKAPLHLVPPAAVIGMADGLAVGAVKYGAYNWREQPIEVMTYVAAAQRHLYAFTDGQDYSEDTEAVLGHAVHHIDHALAGLAILRDALASGKVVDNRPPVGPAADVLRAMDHSVSPAAEPSPEGSVTNVTVSPYFDFDASLASLLDGTWPPVATPPPTIEYHLPNREWSAFETMPDITVEGWGVGDGPIFADVAYRGVWPPDTRVAGRLTCCGATQHELDCPQWR